MTMRPFFPVRCLLAAGLLFPGMTPGIAQEPAAAPLPPPPADPAAKWVSVYGWTQTGDRLAAAEQWALAMGSYIESHRQISELAGAHPAFETELVTYRTEKLVETIATVDSRLSEDEHQTMMKYLDFIESLELGLEQRFSNQYEAALGTLDIARSLLDELIAEKPPEFREAIDSQYRRLEDNIFWLSSQINYKEASRRRPAADLSDGRDWGTTRFVKKEDLPDDSDGVFASGILFPSSLSVNELAGVSVTDLVPLPGKEEDEEPDETAKTDGPRGPAMRLRMNGRQPLGKDDETKPSR
jgi:hypothetical protein